MPVNTFHVRSNNRSNDQVLNIFHHPRQLLVKTHLFDSCVIYCYFMLANKKTVLNETRVRIHVSWTEKSGNDWLI